MGNYTELLQKLERFTRKYYTNQLIRGGLYFTALVAASFLLIVLLEAVGRLGVMARTLMVFTFLSFTLFILIRFVAVPLLKLFQIGQQLSEKQAAIIIGQHFPHVKDKLLNTLELKKLAGLSASENDLIMASINQRSEELKPVPFASAIDLSQNKRYLKYTIPPVGAIVVMLFAAPTLITGPTERLIDYDTHFEAPMPFQFKVKNTELLAIRNEDFLLELETQGEELPAEVFIEVDGLRYRMDRKDVGFFQYKAQNLQENIDFKFYASGFYSKSYELVVLPKPQIAVGSIGINYPDYINKEDEKISGVSDVFIPEGSELTWNLKVQHCDGLLVKTLDSAYNVKPEGDVQLSDRILTAQKWVVVPQSKKLGALDSTTLSINVIKDQKPKIGVKQLEDSSQVTMLYFRGNAQDDYGISKVEFVYAINGGSSQAERIEFNGSSNFTDFMHVVDLKVLNLEPDDKLEYFFQVWDNDGINGAKSARTQTQLLKIPSKREIQEQGKKRSDETKKDLRASIDEAKKLQRDLEALNKKLLEKKTISWEEKKQLKELQNRQKNLQKNFEELKRENEFNNKQKNEFDPLSEDLMQKQKQLEELMEKVLDEDMKKMMEDIQKMMDEMNKEKLQKQIDEMKLDSKQLEKELDRNLELFKQLEFEQKLEETIQNLKDLKEKQQKLAEETKEGKKDLQDLTKEQEKVEKEFKKVQEDLKELDKKNQELEKKNKMPNTKQEEQKAQENMNKSKQQDQQGQKKKSSQSRQNAAQQMQQMEQKMSQMQQQMQQEQQAEDLETLRRLRQNLLQLSFDQEELIDQVKRTQPNDPKFVELTRRQKRITEDSKMIEDSLYALSRRNIQIQSVVNKEMAQVNYNLQKSTDNMANRKIPESLNRQQAVMTSYNNLALIFDESIQKSQKQQSSKKFGKKSCSKPGGGMPSPGDIKKAQQKLSQQLKQLQQQMKQQGGKKPGSRGSGSRGNKMSEQMAKMAAQQAAIRGELRRLMEQSGNKPGGGKGGDQLKKIEKLMDQNEEDLVNRRITQETLKRQQDILSRLLESEKAEREREYDNKRESQSSPNKSLEESVWEEYKREKEKQIEYLETIPLNLKPFYRNKVNEYYNKF
jgi:hypothetical protein